MSKILSLSALLIVIFGATGYYFLNHQRIAPISLSSGNVCEPDSLVCSDGTVLKREGPNCEFPPCPSGYASSFLFQELTIPYLRNKSYNSKLGELQKYSDDGNYISYLTSYSSEGLKVNGLLTVPKREKPAAGWPAVVFIHGYIPPTTYRTTEKYVDYVDYLARNGFVVFKIDLRGHGDSDGEAGGAYYSSDYVADVLNAYSALQNSDLVNPKKIGLWGHSMAGNVILRTLAVRGEISVASIWSGAVYTYLDMVQLGIRDGSYQPPSDVTERQKKRQLLRDTYGDPQSGNPFWKRVIATNYLGDIKGAIQLNHAVDDDVVSIKYSRGLNEILNSTNIPHELKEYSSGGHNISGPEFIPAMQNTVEFFDKYLKNYIPLNNQKSDRVKVVVSE